MQRDEILSKRRTNYSFSFLISKTGSMTVGETCQIHTVIGMPEGHSLKQAEWFARFLIIGRHIQQPKPFLHTNFFLCWQLMSTSAQLEFFESLSSTVFEASLANSGMQTERRWSRSFSVVLRVSVLCVRNKGHGSM